MSTQALKKRKGGAQNIFQMTSAMELVSATKMRRAQEIALSGRSYALTTLEILANVLQDTYLHDQAHNSHILDDIPLLKKLDSDRVLVVIIASDRGLAGSFNSALFSHVERFLLSSSTPKDRYACIAVGIKAAEFIKRSGLFLVQDFSKFADAATVEDIAPIAKLIETQFLTGAFGRVICFSTTFLSALSQKPVLHELLPLSFDTIRHAVEEILPVTGKYSQLRTNLIEHRPEKPPEYLIEPSRQSVIAEISSLLFDTYFYHIVLEANASEHSARRAAMKNAADNASELIDTLTLAYNRLRQASITREIIEITGTAGAMQ